MRLANQEIVKTRVLGRNLAELEVKQIKGGDAKGKFQAHYYGLAEDLIWSDVYDTAEQAIEALDKMVDEYAIKYPWSYGNEEQYEAWRQNLPHNKK